MSAKAGQAPMKLKRAPGPQKKELVRSAPNMDLDVDATRRRLRKSFCRELLFMTPHVLQQHVV